MKQQSSWRSPKRNPLLRSRSLCHHQPHRKIMVVVVVVVVVVTTCRYLLPGIRKFSPESANGPPPPVLQERRRTIKTLNLFISCLQIGTLTTCVVLSSRGFLL